MRKVLAALSLAAALTLLPTAATATQLATTTDRPAQPANVWEDVAWFYNVHDCVQAGDYGRDVGTWSAYECTAYPNRNPGAPWLLRAFYNT